MSRFLIFAVLILSIAQSQSGVMQITLNNLRNVLTTYEQLFILFHNPQCVHSRKYVENFLKIDSNQKLGIVDCLRQIHLCNKYNYTRFPLLAKFGGNDFSQVVDQQQFLVNHKLKEGLQDEVLVNKFVSYLEQDPFYVVVVFEHYGLPTMNTERILQDDSRIIYLQPYNEQNPSNFTKLVSSFVHNKPGCWIFKKSSQNQLEKYYCDNGYNKTITQKFINLFKQNKINKFIFSQEDQHTKNQQIKQYSALDLYNILDKINRVDTAICTLVYFSSNNCPSCRQKDILNIEWVLKNLKINKEIHVGKFDIDQNQIPSKITKLGLKRVPELIYFCNQKIKIFGKVFFLDNLTEFLQIHHMGKHQQITVQSQKNQSKQQQTEKTEFKQQEL